MSKEEIASDLRPIESEKAKLNSLWKAAIVPPALGTGGTIAKALAGGVNFRFHLGKALKAAWETSKAVVSGAKAIHAPFEVLSWLEFSGEVAAAAQSLFECLVERVFPIDYVTAVILSDHFASVGVSPAQLKEEVEKFLANPEAEQFAWYLGMSKKKVEQAQDALDGDWFDLCLPRLEQLGFAVTAPVTGKLSFSSISRHTFGKIAETDSSH
jgi:hypothetical protein